MCCGAYEDRKTHVKRLRIQFCSAIHLACTRPWVRFSAPQNSCARERNYKVRGRKEREGIIRPQVMVRTSKYT